MEELMEYFKEAFSSKNEDISDAYKAEVVKSSINNMCLEHLLEVGDTLVFEVSESNLPYAVAVIGESPLSTQFDINQISKTLFQASIKELDW